MLGRQQRVVVLYVLLVVLAYATGLISGYAYLFSWRMAGEDVNIVWPFACGAATVCWWTVGFTILWRLVAPAIRITYVVGAYIALSILIVFVFSMKVRPNVDAYFQTGWVNRIYRYNIDFVKLRSSVSSISSEIVPPSQVESLSSAVKEVGPHKPDIVVRQLKPTIVDLEFGSAVMGRLVIRIFAGTEESIRGGAWRGAGVKLAEGVYAYADTR